MALGASRVLYLAIWDRLDENIFGTGWMSILFYECRHISPEVQVYQVQNLSIYPVEANQFPKYQIKSKVLVSF